MSHSPVRIALTGATGLLGRNLVYEIVRHHRSNLQAPTLFVIGRSRPGGASLRRRMEDMFDSDEFAPLELSRVERALLGRSVRCVDWDLESPAEMSPAQFAELAAVEIRWFFHIAGLTDLRRTAAAAVALERTNVAGTQRVLDLAARLRPREFCVTSTAYVCGQAGGRVLPETVNPQALFRNPYERTKLAAERLVRQFAETTGIRCRIFRPSTICGRLIDPPFGAVSKFEVFYSWPAFFFRMWHAPGPAALCAPPMRICYDPGQALNIVPVDYVARAMWLLCATEDPGESYHLVNDHDTPHALLVSRMLELMGVAPVRQVAGIPGDPTRLEAMYYRSVGAVYTPYLIASAMRFDTRSVSALGASTGLRCPPIDDVALRRLLVYALARRFGMPDHRARAAWRPRPEIVDRARASDAAIIAS